MPADHKEKAFEAAMEYHLTSQDGYKPRVLYPHHQGESDPAEIKKLLADVKEIEVRVLPLP